MLKFEEGWEELQRIIFLQRQSQEQIMGQCKEIKQIWKRPKSFSICFSLIFSC